MQSHDHELLVIYMCMHIYIWHLGNISNFLEVNDACSTGNWHSAVNRSNAGIPLDNLGPKVSQSSTGVESLII